MIKHVRAPSVAAISTLLTLSLLSASPARAAESCAPSTPYASGIAVVKATRVYTAANGESAFEPIEIKSEGKAYFKPGEIFRHAELGAAKSVQIIQGPPNAKLPLHSSPYLEMFLTIQGSSTVVLPTGQELEVTPGTLVIMDDMGSKSGHGGRTGPCGYVALNIVPADLSKKP